MFKKECNIKFGSKSGDIYSMAIIASEVINMKTAWKESTENNKNRFTNAEEIIYLVKKGGVLPKRPILKPIVDNLNLDLVNKYLYLSNFEF